MEKIEELQKRMRDGKIRQRAVAKVIGVHESWLSHRFSGRRAVTDGDLFKIEMAILRLARADQEAQKARERVLAE